MPASNIARYYFALQSAKGAPAAAPQYSIDVTGADLAPTPETETRSETGLGRDPGDSYIRVLAAGGGVTTLLRPKTAALLLYGVLGAKAVTGTTRYSHAITPANDQPYMTWWRMVGDSIFERFDDCKITGMNIEWAAGGDVSAALSVIGLNFARLAAIPAGAVYESGPPLRVPGVVYTVEGAVDNSITSGNVNIEAGQTAIQTTAITNSYLEPSARNITLSWEQVYSDVGRYAKALYGSAAGLTPSATIYEGAVKFEFVSPGNAAEKGLTLDIPRVGFSPSTVNPDAGGDPLRLPVAGQAYRPGSGAIITATVINDVASYAPAP